MKNKMFFLKLGKGTCAVAVVVGSLLAGPVAQADDFHASVNVTVPTVAPNTFDAQDDYVYYPAYHVYYSKHHHRYAYLKNNAWVAAPTPPDVSVNVLKATPSVDMDFHDSPAKHHEEIVKKYPKDWVSPTVRR